MVQFHLECYPDILVCPNSKSFKEWLTQPQYFWSIFEYSEKYSEVFLKTVKSKGFEESTLLTRANVYFSERKSEKYKFWKKHRHFYH